MQSEMVPAIDSPSFTRDMDVSEPHGFARPPYAKDAEQCAAQLLDLHRWFGTKVFVAALASFEADEDYQARVRGLDPEQDIRVHRRVLSGLGEEAEQLLAEFEALTRALPVATPYPGATAVPAQSTAATAA